MRNDNQLGLTSLNERGYVVQTILYNLRLSSSRLGLSTSSSDGSQTVLLLSLGLRAIFVEKSEKGLGW